MHGLIGLAGTLAILFAIGGTIGLADRRRFSLRWLAVAALLVAINDALLTGLYGMLPDVIGGAKNWQGKLLALGATLAIAAFPRFGWHPVGLTLRQARGSLCAALPVMSLYVGLFVALALVSDAGRASVENTAFQLTMPGFEEETFYRGILLLALDRAFVGRTRFLGIDWGWGAILSSLLFGVAHGFGFSGNGFSFDAVTIALTAIPAFIAVWLRLRTGSLLLPIVLHNFGNSISLLL